MRARHAFALTLLAALAAGSAFAQSSEDFVFALPPELVFERAGVPNRSAAAERFARETPPEALKAFQSAVEKADRIDYDGAMDDFIKAAALAPQSIELQFVAANFSRRMAEMSYGDKSLRYYDEAETALRRLLANPQLGPEERARALRASERVRVGKDGLRARDQARYEAGFGLVLNIRDERLEKSAELNPGLKKLREAELAKKDTEKKEETAKRPSPWQEDDAPNNSIIETVQGQVTGNAATNLVDPLAASLGAPGGDPFAAGASADPFASPGAGTDPFAAPAGGDPVGAPAAAPAAQPAGAGVAGVDYPL